MKNKFAFDGCKRVSPWRGLMFRPKPKTPVIIDVGVRRTVRLHTWFVFYPIDVAFLAVNRRILGVRRVRPFSFHTFSANVPVAHVVEAPAGILQNYLEGEG